MFSVTAGYHRYFSHRSYKTSRPFQFLLALAGTLAVQKGVLWWAANHRNHHKYSDQAEDLHSPLQRGFWWAHVGWILSPDYEETDLARIPDMAKYPELRWLNDHYLIPPVVLAVALYLIGGATWLVWGFFISTTMLWHATFTINSLAHVWGSRRYETTDTSRNNPWLALLTMGEGWHNNHHRYMNSARQGFFWWEIDLSYYILVALSWCGIVWDLQQPPKRLLEPQPQLSAELAENAA
jgi:stearoyl-CoA desaturase (delta-9 desaturase)